MSNKNASKLRLSLLFSSALHLAIIVVVGYSAFIYTTSYSEVNNSSINAVIVDPTIVSEQNLRQIKQKEAMEKREKQRQAQAIEKERFIEEQRIIEQRRLKAIEKQRLAALEQQQMAVAAAKKAAKAKAQLEEEQKKALLAKQQAVVEKQREQVLDDILGDLVSTEPSATQGAKLAEINQYKSLVQRAITNKFTNSDFYRGKNCVINILIGPDGILLDAASIEGDALLCREAISATKKAVIPKPASEQLYAKVKHITIDFRPK